jgi:hypothetical protein
VLVVLCVAAAAGAYTLFGTSEALVQGNDPADAGYTTTRKKRSGKVEVFSFDKIANLVSQGGNGIKALVDGIDDGSLPDTEASAASIVKAVYCGRKKCSQAAEAYWRQDMDVLRLPDFHGNSHATPSTLLYQETFLDQDIKPLVSAPDLHSHS